VKPTLPSSLQSMSLSQPVSRFQCTACGARFIDQPLVVPVTCPSCGCDALVLIEMLPLTESWFHLLPRVEV
jgi:hypothetical protein